MDPKKIHTIFTNKPYKISSSVWKRLNYITNDRFTKSCNDYIETAIRVTSVQFRYLHYECVASARGRLRVDTLASLSFYPTSFIPLTLNNLPEVRMYFSKYRIRQWLISKELQNSDFIKLGTLLIVWPLALHILLAKFIQIKFYPIKTKQRSILWRKIKLAYRSFPFHKLT